MPHTTRNKQLNMESEKYIAKSKFEILYISKQIVGFSIGLIVIFLFFYNSFGNYGFIKPNFILGIISVIIFTILYISIARVMTTVALSEKGIEVCKPLLNSKKYYLYENIDFITLARKRGVYVTGTRERIPFIGGHLLVIKFKNDDEIYFSPKEFENFKELVDIISTRHNTC